jgi:hypothetical protein
MSMSKLKMWRVLFAALLAVFSLFGAQAAEKDQFAIVQRLSGTVAVQVPGVPSRALHLGDWVRVGERVSAGPDGDAVLRTSDLGIIAIRPNSEFVMEAYSAKEPSQDQFVLRVFRGALRMVTGFIGKRSAGSVHVRTPTATIGVRGTDYEPYVLTPDSAAALGQTAGTYNRVYSGATTIESYGESLDVGKGQVALAPSAPLSKTRALMTALLPVLLDKVPDFYQAGLFDEEFALINADNQGTTPEVPATQKPVSASPVEFGFESEVDTPHCAQSRIAQQWLNSLDTAVARKDSRQFMALFAHDLNIEMQVRKTDGAVVSIKLDRDSFAKSTKQSLEQLSNFKSTRPEVRVRQQPGDMAMTCERVEVESLVEESGVRGGNAYKLRSMESFTLEKRRGRWLAIQAKTVQW